MRILFVVLALCLCSSVFAQTNYLTYKLKQGENFTVVLKKFKITPIEGPDGKLKEMRDLNREIIKATNARLPIGYKVLLPVTSLPTTEKYTVNNFGEVVEVNQNINVNNVNVAAPVRDVVIVTENPPADQLVAPEFPNGRVTKIRITRDSPLAQRLAVLGVLPTGQAVESYENVYVVYPEKSPAVAIPPVQQNPSLGLFENPGSRGYDPRMTPPRYILMETDPAHAKSSGPIVGVSLAPAMIINWINLTMNDYRATKVSSNPGIGLNTYLNFRLNKIASLRPWFNIHYLNYDKSTPLVFTNPHQTMHTAGLEGRFFISKNLAASVLAGYEKFSLSTRTTTQFTIINRMPFIIGAKLSIFGQNDMNNFFGLDLGITGINGMTHSTFKTRFGYSATAQAFFKHDFMNDWSVRFDLGSTFSWISAGSNKFRQRSNLGTISCAAIWNINGP
jgi:hypothetical protein